MTRVLYINEVSWIGGAEGALIDLTANLNPQQYSSIVVCPDEGEFPQTLRLRGVDTAIVPFYGLKARNPLRYFQTIGQLRSIVKQKRIDVIHVNQQYFSNYSVVLGKMCRVPVLVHLRGVETDEFFSRFARYMMASDSIIAVSEAAKSRYLEYIGRKMGKKKAEIVSKRVRVVYDGFKPPEKGLSSEELHQEFGIPPKSRIVGIVGQVTPEKGLAEFVDAARQVLKAHEDVHFLVVGADPDKERDYATVVKATIEGNGMDEHFTFAGFRRDAASLISGMDVSVLASWQDAFPRVLLESMAAETPVVATRVGGVPEMVEDGVSGLLVAPKDSRALAEGIIRALEMDNEQRQEMARCGRERVRGFSVEEHVSQVTEVYQKLMER